MIVDRIAAILAAALPPGVALERARNIAQVATYDGCTCVEHVAEQLRAARLPCYGAVSIDDEAIAALAIEVCALCDCGDLLGVLHECATRRRCGRTATR